MYKAHRQIEDSKVNDSDGDLSSDDKLENRRDHLVTNEA
jgi:hypothetical protein